MLPQFLHVCNGNNASNLTDRVVLNINLVLSTVPAVDKCWELLLDIIVLTNWQDDVYAAKKSPENPLIMQYLSCG